MALRAGERGQQALKWHDRGTSGDLSEPRHSRGLSAWRACCFKHFLVKRYLLGKRNQLSLFAQGSAQDWSAILVGQNPAPETETRLRRTHPSGNTRKFLRRREEGGGRRREGRGVVHCPS